MNEAEMVVTVEPGAILGYLYHTLWKKGKFGTIGGSCLSVAMGGLVLGGGIGYFSNTYGLVIDNLEEMNMVDASGNEVHINSTHNEDLWWAMRGVGPGYIGLVTSVKLKMFKADTLRLTHLRIRFRNKEFKNVMGNFFKWLDWVKKNDPNITTVIVVRSDNFSISHQFGKPDVRGIAIDILQVRQPDENPSRDFVASALNIFDGALSYRISSPNFIQFFDKLGYVSNAPNYKKNDEKLKFSQISPEKSRSHITICKNHFFVKEPYSAKRFEEAQKILLATIPQNEGVLVINSEQGEIGKRQPNESAYIHRDALFNFKISIDVEREEDVAMSRSWMNNFYESVKFMDSGRTFQNYPEKDLDLERFYGTNLKKLIEIKNKWDPNHYFNSENSLPRTYNKRSNI